MSVAEILTALALFALVMLALAMLWLVFSVLLK